MNKSNHSPARPDWWQFAEDCARRYHLYYEELQQTRRKTLKEDAPDDGADTEEPLVSTPPEQPSSLLHHLSKHPDARRFKTVSFEEALKRDIKVMDQSALILARDRKKPVHIFNFDEPGSVMRICNGEDVGTLVTPDAQAEYA